VKPHERRNLADFTVVAVLAVFRSSGATKLESIVSELKREAYRTGDSVRDREARSPSRMIEVVILDAWDHSTIDPDERVTEEPARTRLVRWTFQFRRCGGVR
jgi:hypothetical protein